MKNDPKTLALLVVGVVLVLGIFFGALVVEVLLEEQTKQVCLEAGNDPKDC